MNGSPQEDRKVLPCGQSARDRLPGGAQLPPPSREYSVPSSALGSVSSSLASTAGIWSQVPNGYGIRQQLTVEDRAWRAGFGQGQVSGGIDRGAFGERVVVRVRIGCITGNGGCVAQRTCGRRIRCAPQEYCPDGTGGERAQRQDSRPGLERDPVKE